MTPTIDAPAAVEDPAARAGRRGRPRDAKVDEAVLAATVELLGDGGIAGLSMDQVARRAGVGKSTIYRRWASKEELVLEALSSAPPLPVPDTGTVRGDLLAYAMLLAELASKPRSDVLPHLIEASCYDERLRASLNDYSRSRQRVLRSILDRGVARGEIDETADREIIIDMLSGTFFYRRLVSGESFSRRFATRLVDAALRSIGCRTS